MQTVLRTGRVTRRSLLDETMEVTAMSDKRSRILYIKRF